tara:strand:+ start:263 stop:718 length:456 start_codon:yes stop_codon:yes gene_type:complete
MKRNAFETILGALVLVVAGLFVFFATDTAQIKTVDGYEVTAKFFKIGGLTTGSDVRINGIKVGTVISAELDRETYDAVLTMNIESGILLPKDTAAGIGSEGIVGGKYVRLEPGMDQVTIPPGGGILNTTDFRSLEDQVGEIIFLATGGQGG